ncbi:MAG: formylglycine-generating enzyme family protein [Rhodopseudomonas sp.]|uniref:formylglycine-generating enzyme family protein n=1 Tax=Rhodopseudomonas sp. TaxID=1078 RepID=UPI0018478429|nr:formylglycine-generating enzyme family protein [Rhodopseudomonas sp.]NVN88280.1 formylglycine-generating enzyme family protein [Rhodopseudomonas sp.]
MKVSAGPPSLVDGKPPTWASGCGRDRRGVFAEFSLTAVRQRLRWIPPGRFRMGSPENEAGRFDNEEPRHVVVIGEGFWLFDTPCTQALWEAVMGENPSRFRSASRPVESVTFDAVQEFLSRINRMVPGLELALPTEAQWEYACRAGTSKATYAGNLRILGWNNAPVLDAIAWYGGNSGVGFELEDGWNSELWREQQYPHQRAGTHPVGLKAPNAWGLYDMLGNVWEWCEDRWHGSYLDAPSDGSAWLEPGQRPTARVVRGGSWFDGSARNARSASRYFGSPDYSHAALGFRCARFQP